MIFVVILLIMAVNGGITAAVAKSRGHSFVVFLIVGALLGLVIGIILALVIQPSRSSGRSRRFQRTGRGGRPTTGRVTAAGRAAPGRASSVRGNRPTSVHRR